MFTRCKWLLVHVYGLQLFVHIFNVECTEYNLRVTCAQARHSQTQRSNALLNIVERSKTYAYSMRDQFTCIGVFVWYKYKGQQIPALLLRIFAGKFLVNISCKMRQCWLTVFSTLLSICREIDSPYTLKWIERYQRYATSSHWVSSNCSYTSMNGNATKLNKKLHETLYHLLVCIWLQQQKQQKQQHPPYGHIITYMDMEPSYTRVWKSLDPINLKPIVFNKNM